MSLISSIKGTVAAFVDLLYPKACPVCHNALDHTDGMICGECLQNVDLFSKPLCSRCGRQLCGTIAPGVRCEHCREEEHVFDRLIAIGRYEGRLKECIHAFKFGKKSSLGGWFAGVMVSFFRNNDVNLGGYDLIVPVPMHPSRKKERGFDQAEVLSLHLSRMLDIPCLPGCMRRNEPGMVQSKLKRMERFRNVDGAFQVCGEDAVRGKCLILVDDIVTTGATADACAAALKGAGARQVAVLAVARGR